MASRFDLHIRVSLKARLLLRYEPQVPIILKKLIATRMTRISIFPPSGEMVGKASLSYLFLRIPRVRVFD